MTDAPDALPGLELPDQLEAQPASPLLEAVDTTLDQLERDGHLDPVRDAARRELSRTLARIIATKDRTGRASTVGNDARVLMDLLDGMVPAAAASSVDTRLAEAMDKWTAELEGKGTTA